MKVVTAFVYILAMVVANMSVWYFGPWISPINSFLFIGFDLVMRDFIHEQNNGDVRVIGSIVISASVITYLLNPAAQHIAIASAVAFSAAAVVDWLVYSKLKNHKWLARSNGSNAAGAVTDSVLFPTIAFGVFSPAIIALQFAAKFFGGALWSVVIGKVKK